MEKDTKKESSSKNKWFTFEAIRKWLEKWGLLCFVSAWMFILGVLVGRATIPSQFDIHKIKKELTTLKEAMLRKEMNRFNINPGKDDGKTELAFHEELKKNKTGNEWKPGKISEPDEKQEPEKPPVPEKPAVAVKSENKHEKPQPREVSHDTEKKNPNPANGNKQLSVQVTSFKDAAIADKKVEELKQKGFPAYRSSGEIPGKGTWHRVRIGPFNSKADAKATIDKLKASKYNPMIVNAGQ